MEIEDDQLMNPVVLFEVLSKSTKDYDRGSKFAHYRSISSLKDYVLVAQDKFHVEHFTRKPGNMWLLSETDGLDAEIRIPSLDVRLKLADIYRKLDLLKDARRS